MDERPQRGVWWWVKRLVWGALIAIAALLATGLLYQTAANVVAANTYPPPGQLVDVGGRRLHLYCLGEGSPTVILETGLGDNSTIWSLVQPAIAETTRVCAYDRAGFGWSDDGPPPRDSESIVHELKTLLANAGIEPPYVLVGHSIAGLHSRLYAHQYPQDVVGMVLIDPSHEEQGERFPAELMALQDADIRLFNLCRFAAPFGIVRLLGVFNHSALPLDVRQAADMLSYQNRLCRSILLEIEETEPNTEQMAGVDSLGDTPLVVLSRGRPPSLNDMPSGATAELVEQMELVWQELQKEHAARSSKGRQIIARESGHYIHIGQPQLVIEAVRQVVEQAR